MGSPLTRRQEGKVARFHRTVAAEVFAHQRPTTLAEAQDRCTAFRTISNQERPHEALANLVPASAYQPSLRPFPEIVPPVSDDEGELVCTVTVHGSISGRGRRRFISRGLVGEPVALRPTVDPAVWSVVSCARQVATIDRRSPDEVGPMSPHTCHLCLRSIQTALEMTRVGVRHLVPCWPGNEILRLRSR